MPYNNRMETQKTNKLNVFIVEDDENDLKELTSAIEKYPQELNLAGSSKSAFATFDFIRNHLPHAVILDLELQNGQGDGLSLLDKLNNTVLPRKPYILVNTYNKSDYTRKTALNSGADYVFTKQQDGYSAKMVVDHLLKVKPILTGSDEKPSKPLTEARLENAMREFVQEEFNKLGLIVKHDGYEYLVEAVLLAAKGETQNWDRTIAEKFGKSAECVNHAMQYTLKTTWKRADINNLLKYFTIPLPGDKPEPTVTTFVFFYKRNLLNYFNNIT